MFIHAMLREMERKIPFGVDEYYHVYNRGVEKRLIFLDKSDRDRFLRLLYLANGTKPVIYRDVPRRSLSDLDMGEKLVAIGAYCLMPNHFHLLLKEISDGGISLFMAKLTTSYAKYFNKKYKRVGPLFQSRFKAGHLMRDEHLKYLYAYIHLNPVKLLEPEWREKGIMDKERMRRYLEAYWYSSYQDYAGMGREESAILSQEQFPEYFSSPHEFEGVIKDWLEYHEHEEEIGFL